MYTRCFAPGVPLRGDFKGTVLRQLYGFRAYLAYHGLVSGSLRPADSRASESARSNLNDRKSINCADRGTLGTRHLARDALSQPVASTPSLGYTELITRAAPQTLSLALRMTEGRPARCANQAARE